MEMGSRQISNSCRAITNKLCQSSKQVGLSMHNFRLEEKHKLHSKAWHLPKSLSKLMVDHHRQIVDKDNDKQDLREKPYFPSGVCCIPHSTTNSSTATATQHAPNNEEEQHEGKFLEEKKIEYPPEQCDQAIKGLSSVKAKAKQVHDPHKKEKSFIKTFWASLIGIRPAPRAVALMRREDCTRKLQQWRNDFFEVMQHYWMGTKLLWVDVRISFRLWLKFASGKSLTRRERQHLTRTTADIFRLVPFAEFIIVPFMEFMLPVLNKIFPNMLPSTFQNKMKEQEQLIRQLNIRIEYAKFLQDTVKEMAREIKTSHSGELKQTAEELDAFMNKVFTSPKVSNEEILGFAKLLNDELTLDNIGRPRLEAICEYMEINPYGTDAYSRYKLSSKLASFSINLGRPI